MRIAILVALVLLALFAAGPSPRLLVMLTAPDGSMSELASQPVTCGTAPPLKVTTSFGTAPQCRQLCSSGPAADGNYSFSIGVVPELRCSGPEGSLKLVPNTGALDRRANVSFCTDDACSERVDYCDCIAPNITANPVNGFRSAPFIVTVSASDNHAIDSLTTRWDNGTCTNTTCTLNATMPIGTACTISGTGTCPVRITATDLAGNTAEIVERYDVDLDAPNATHTWLGSGSRWARDTARLKVSASEPGTGQSGLAAIWIEERHSPGCSPPGANYTRHAVVGTSSSVEVETTGETGAVRYCYYATDRAIPANHGQVRSTEAREIDATPAAIEVEPSGTLFARDLNLSVLCADAGSGCASLETALSNGTCPPAGSPAWDRGSRLTTSCGNDSSCELHVCAIATDGVGHVSSLDRPITIDRSPPVVRIVSTKRETGTLVVDALISDVGSGVMGCTANSTDATGAVNLTCTAANQTSEAIIDVPCAGNCSYTVEATDRAGNVGSASSTH